MAVPNLRNDAHDRYTTTFSRFLLYYDNDYGIKLISF